MGDRLIEPEESTLNFSTHGVRAEEMESRERRVRKNKESEGRATCLI